MAAWVCLLLLAPAPPTARADSPNRDAGAPLTARADVGDEGPGSAGSTGPVASDPTADASPTWSLGGWRITWDDGLHFELRRLVPLLPSWLTPPIHHDRPLVTGTVGVKIQVDAAAYPVDRGLPDISSGVELRRGRVFAEGEFLLIRPISFKVEFGVTKDSVSLDDFYLGLRDLPLVGTLKVGQLKAPFSLENLTGSLDTTFMERAAPVDAFAPGYLAGLVVQTPTADRRMTGALGWFSAGAGEDTGDASESLSRVVGRVTWLPHDDGSSSSPRLVHLGLSASYVFSATESIRYRSRPESHLAPILVDTGDIKGQTAGLVGFEAAVVHGSLLGQGEGIVALVEPRSGGRLTFWGFYVSGSWLLTGESRSYDRQTGVFSPIVPRQPFSIQRGQLGAWEWGVRWSYVDLDDRDVRGGRMGILSTGLNWYPNRHWRVALEYGFTHVDGTAGDGTLHTLQTRVQLRY